MKTPSKHRPRQPNRHRAPLLLRPLLLALAAALPLVVMGQSRVPALPPVPANALPVPAVGWRVHGQGPGLPSYTDPRANMVVTQESQRAIYRWDSFSVGKSASVLFDMPKGGGSALNRVIGTEPSQIFGSLRTTNGGELFLINQNGVLFGNGAKVDVGSLVVSTLNLNDEDFKAGLSRNITGSAPAFAYDGRQDNATPFVDAKHFVRVEPGADLRSAEGGRIFLFAKRVENEGLIEAKGGQVVLAGGGDIQLKLPTAEALYASEVNPNVPALRGLLVEVGSARDRDGKPLADAGGSVLNAAGGQISTPRGNTTLVGLAVNQSGRISATTSVAQNGSILLLAQGAAPQATLDSVTPSDNRYKRASQSGSLVLGPGSVTEVLPDNKGADGKPLSSDDNATFVSSRVDLAGRSIELQPQASVRAPGAVVNLRAQGTPDYRANVPSGNPFTANDAGARIVLGAEASVDVSGTTDTEVSVARNFATTELLGSNDLKDAPLQKLGPLYRNRINFDLRGEVPVLGDISSYRRAVQRSASERLATGGTVSMRAEGAVVAHQSSRLNVSGGQVTFSEAQVRPSSLVADNGQVYSLSAAPKDLAYVNLLDAGVSTSAFDRWGVVVKYGSVTPTRLEAGYVEGRSAGSLNVLAPSVLLDGSLSAQAQQGRRQLAGLDALASGGRLALGAAKNGVDFGNGSYVGAVLDSFTLTPTGQRQSDLFWASPLTQTIGTGSRLSAPEFNRAGFAQFSVAAENLLRVEKDAALSLPDGGSMELLSNRGAVDVRADVHAAAGSITLRSLDGGDVRVASGVQLDTAGRWVNTLLDGPASRAAIGGGSITLDSRRSVDLGAGTVLDASGGGLVSPSGAITGGDAGKIKLSAGRSSATSDASQRVLKLGGELRGFAIGKGGSLSLTSQGVRVGSAAAGDPAADLSLTPEFFNQGGFSGFSLEGRQFLDISAGTQIAPRVQSWLPEAAARLAPSGSATRELVSTAKAELPRPVSLDFKGSGLDRTTDDGWLRVGAGATFDLTPLSKLTFAGAGRLDFAGSVHAAGGSVSLSLLGSKADSQAQYLWLRPQSQIDVAGATQLTPGTDGLRRGQVLAGGSISVDASQGFANSLVWSQGSRLDVRGSADTLDVALRGDAGTSTASQRIASAGGSVSFAGNQDMLLEGSLSAAGGDASKAGGSLKVALQTGRLSDDNNLPPLRELVLGAERGQATVNLTAAGLKPAAQLTGRAALSAQTVRESGVADLTLEAQERVRIDGGIALDLPRELRIDSQALSMGGSQSSSLSASTLFVGNSRKLVSVNSVDRALPEASAGTAGLKHAGDLLVLDGRLATQGIGQLELASQGDLRLQSRGASDGSLQGQLLTQAELALKAQQIYPATDTRFSIDAGAHQVTVGGGSASADKPFSAGGSLIINAATITQGGVLRAPGGRIELNATGGVTLAAGSETSVSSSGQTLLYGSATGSTWSLPGATGQIFASAPSAKTVLLQSGTGAVTVAAGATLDLRAGGDLLGWQFVPGPGGSSDLFSGSDGAFAVLPGVKGAAPFDNSLTGAPTRIGRQITVGEGALLPAGTYTLLPARYAVLDGAYLVKPVAGGTAMSLGTALKNADGSVLAGAQLSDANTGFKDALPGNWLISSSSLARRSAEIRLSNADTFFTALSGSGAGEVSVPRRPVDAGALVISANAASLAGQVRFDAAPALSGKPAGRGGQAFFAADRIVVGDAAQAESGALNLGAAQLNQLGAQSLVLGAVPAATGGGTLQVRASRVAVADGASDLNQADLLLAARQQIQLADGVHIKASAANSADTRDSGVFRIVGDGAALRVSASDLAPVVRTGASRAEGELVVGQGVEIATPTGHGSVTLDATRSTKVAADLGLSSAHVSMGAGRIALTGADAALADPQTLRLSPSLVAQLAGRQELTLRSYSSIDLGADAPLGSAQLPAWCLTPRSCACRGAMPRHAWPRVG